MRYVIVVIMLVVIVGGGILSYWQWMKNKELTEAMDFLTQKNEQLERGNKELEKENEELRIKKEELRGAIEELKEVIIVRSRQYTNEKYGLEIKHFTDEAPYTHEWEGKRHPNMPRRLWDASLFDSNYGKTFDHRTGITVIHMTVNECLPQEDIESCLSVITSHCGTVPYGRIEEIYGEKAELEISSTFSFLNSPAKRLKVSCLTAEQKEGIAVLRKNRLYTILFLTSSETYTPLPKALIEIMLSTFRFLD